MNNKKTTKAIEIVPLNAIERSPILISTFSNGYTSDWKFKLPISFKAPLDIKYTARVVGKTKYSVLTQGQVFNFQVGDSIYDSTLAYTLPWGEALKAIRFAITVNKSTEDSTVTDEIIHVRDEDLKLNMQKFIDGRVAFSLLRSDLNPFN